MNTQEGNMAVSNKSALNYFVTASAGVSDPNVTTGALYKAVNANSGTLAETGKAAFGVLTQVASVGMRVTYELVAIAKIACGAALTVGQDITVTTSGYFIAADSGDTIVGRATTNATSGSVGQAAVNFITPKYAVNCLAVNY